VTINAYSEGTDISVQNLTDAQKELVIDQKKFMAKMRGCSVNTTTGMTQSTTGWSPFSLAVRSLVSWTRSKIHILATPEFTREELHKFIDESLSGDSRVNFISDLIRETSEERLSKAPDGLSDTEKDMIAHEVLRKMMQFSASGTTTEHQYDRSRAVAALARLNPSEKGNLSIKTVIEMLKMFGMRCGSP